MKKNRSKLPSKNQFGFLGTIIKKRDVGGVFLGGVGLLLVNIVLSLLFPKLYSQVIDTFLANGTFATKSIYLIGLLGIINIVLAYLQAYIIRLASERLGYYLRENLFKKIVNQSEKFFHEKDSSKLLTIIMNDINNVKQILAMLITNSISSILILIGSVFLMLSINSQLGLVIIASVGLTTIFIVFLMRKMGDLFQKRQKKRDIFNRIIKENVQASTLIRVFVAEKLEINKFANANAKIKDLSIKISQKFSLIVPMINFVNYLASFWILIIGGKEVIGGNMSLGDITAFQNYVNMFIMPILSFGFMSAMAGQAMVSIKRIGEVLNEKTELKNGTIKINQQGIKSVELKNVSFANQDNKILHNINLRVNRGEKIGIIGLTGSGKSLMLKTIVRLIEPTSGKILINNRNINQYEINSLRRRIGFVFQNDYLINGSLADNIKFGRQVSRQELKKIVKIANVDQIAAKFSKGLNHNIGEQGRKLSGGQKQRVRIARALASNPDLLILDDCTSNLDVKTEKKIIKNIKDNYQDIALIIVSEKIASIKDCERIYVVDGGKIVGTGTHEELLKTTFLYQEIELTQKNYAQE
ncbi:MAG: ABC transporter related protein [Microgenomates bacterium 39_6]|nr:MAG: ABC transporter related protein [Microgenomates bacterium 39_6]